MPEVSVAGQADGSSADGLGRGFLLSHLSSKAPDFEELMLPLVGPELWPGLDTYSGAVVAVPTHMYT